MCAGAIKTAFEFFANQAGIGIPEWLPTPASREYAAAVARLDAIIYDIIDQRRLELGTGQRSAQALPSSQRTHPPLCRSLKSMLLGGNCFWTDCFWLCLRLIVKFITAEAKP